LKLLTKCRWKRVTTLCHSKLLLSQNVRLLLLLLLLARLKSSNRWEGCQHYLSIRVNTLCKTLLVTFKAFREQKKLNQHYMKMYYENPCCRVTSFFMLSKYLPRSRTSECSPFSNAGVYVLNARLGSEPALTRDRDLPSCKSVNAFLSERTGLGYGAFGTTLICLMTFFRCVAGRLERVLPVGSTFPWHVTLALC